MGDGDIGEMGNKNGHCVQSLPGEAADVLGRMCTWMWARHGTNRQQDGAKESSKNTMYGLSVA